MLIGQLSKRSELSRDTIRFYEKEGLISQGERLNKFNDYKDYSEETLHRLFSIKRLKNFGFTLNEISEILEMLDLDEATCKNVSSKIDEKVLSIEQKIAALRIVRKQLIDGKKNCQDENGILKTPENTCPVFGI